MSLSLFTGAAEQTGGSSSSSRPSSLPYSHQVRSPTMSPRPQESLQHRPTVLHNTSSKTLQSSEHSSPSVLRSDTHTHTHTEFNLITL